MPRSNGTYSLPPIYEATPGTTVRSEQHNVPLLDIAQALTGSLPRDGSAPMQGNIPMGGRKVTGMGVPTLAGDAATKSYVDGYVPTNIPAPNITVASPGVVGRQAAGSGPASIHAMGDGLELVPGVIRAKIGAGLSFVSGAITAVVSRFSTTAEAEAGADNTSAMTPLRVREGVFATTIGRGQTWQNVRASRVNGNWYTNSTLRPIQVSVAFGVNNAYFNISTNGGTTSIRVAGCDLSAGSSACIIVPVGVSYMITDATTWAELR